VSGCVGPRQEGLLGACLKGDGKLKVDPNQPVDLHHEMILCDGGCVELADGARIALSELDSQDNALAGFCRSLDPNKCFIVAMIPSEADREVFFKARQVASGMGIHMQAPVEEPDKCRRMWEQHVLVRRMAGDSSEEPGADANS
jgi:hypothetical protein